jgi:hypothetical protein
VHPQSQLGLSALTEESGGIKTPQWVHHDQINLHVQRGGFCKTVAVLRNREQQFKPADSASYGFVGKGCGTLLRKHVFRAKHDSL